jgi:uncharacterized surface protein with fasciclin (FAS1) repeats
MALACAAAALATFVVAACKPPEQEARVAPAPVELPAAEPAGAPATTNIIDSATAAGRFSKFVAAAKAAGLDGALKSQSASPFTVFMPTDEAFDALPAGVLDDLMKPANKAKLAELLKKHVVDQQFTSDMAKGARTQINTQAGEQIVVDGTGDELKVSDAVVVQADIDASNGVIHAIDKVIQ